jgi:hypothetical protein
MYGWANLNSSRIVESSYSLEEPFPDFLSPSAFFLACTRTSLNLLSASSTSPSSSRLNAARTYAVFCPLGENTVPGNARTPRARASVRMSCSDSPSAPSLEGGRISLNLARIT